jgi:hypothetical protein
MEILTMGRLFIKFHLNSRNDFLDQLSALFIRSTGITVSMNTKNRHKRILSKSEKFIVEISFSNNMSAALDSQPIGVFNNPLMLPQNLRRHSEPRSTHYDSREGSMNKVSPVLLKPFADAVPDCFGPCGVVVLAW